MKSDNCAIYTDCIDINSPKPDHDKSDVYTCRGTSLCYKNTYPDDYTQWGCGSSDWATTVLTSFSDYDTNLAFPIAYTGFAASTTEDEEPPAKTRTIDVYITKTPSAVSKAEEKRDTADTTLYSSPTARGGIGLPPPSPFDDEPPPPSQPSPFDDEPPPPSQPSPFDDEPPPPSQPSPFDDEPPPPPQPSQVDDGEPSPTYPAMAEGTTSSAAEGSGKPSTPVGAIAGGVVGGIAGVTLVVAGAYFLLRSKRRKSAEAGETQQQEVQEASGVGGSEAQNGRISELYSPKQSPGPSELYSPSHSPDPRRTEATMSNPFPGKAAGPPVELP
ncbi:hypothetical protein K4F52_000932 [Lecanicillium sp. MT-2017a]|nr:hypothetical protein K4F52_000932 [Lecanicillium sp. MT-2017a]